MVFPGKQWQSPISTARAYAVRAEIPRRQPNLAATAANSVSR